MASQFDGEYKPTTLEVICWLLIGPLFFVACLLWAMIELGWIK